MDEQDLRYLLGSTIYSRAKAYADRGAVRQMSCTTSKPGVLHIKGVVQGKHRYETEVWLRENGTFVSAGCSCPYNQRGEGPLCKHIGALLLAHLQEEKPSAPAPAAVPGVVRGSELAAAQESRRTSYASNLEMLFGRKWRDPEPESDAAVGVLLKQFAEMDPLPEPAQAGPPAAAGSVRLEPELTLQRGQLASLRLRISGGGRWYIVKDLPQMLEAVEQKRTLRYGQQLEFCHSREAFEPLSQKLLELLRRQLELRRYLAQTGQGPARPSGPAQTPGALLLTGETLDALAALYEPEGLLGGYTLRKGMPRMTLRVGARRGGMQLALAPELGVVWGLDWGYLFSADTLWQVSRAELARLGPALQALGGAGLFFTRSDAAAFCSYVLPELKIQLEDPENLLLSQLPLPPVVQFYLDSPRAGVVTVRPEFVYGEQRVTPDKAPAGLVRDKRAEQRAARLLEKYLTPEEPQSSPALYRLEEEEGVCRFLEEGIPALLEAGEVYLSDEFRNLSAPAPRIAVGVSVSGSVLDLEIDTGEFPPEELRELLASLRQKKRYHRLRDGRFLRLDDSLAALGELDETLELAGVPLGQARARLPLYRAPSLDQALSGQSGVRFDRDDAFRRISRSFHAVRDSEYVLPESLQKVLRRYQREGYRWLRTLDGYGMGGILADDMGLGKTLQVLAYLLALKQEGRPGPSLIVCPASLVFNWGEECARFTPELRCLLMDGDAARRASLAQQMEQYDLVVTSYDLLRRDEALYAEREFSACILDEAQAIKNHTTQKYKAACRLRSRVRFALTGTPVENRLGELWSIFSFLMPGYLPSYPVFLSRFEKPIVQDRDEGAVRRLNQLTGPFILRRMKAQVLTELPPKMEKVQRVALDAEQRRLYLAAVLDAKERLRAAKPEDRMAVFAVLMRLRQICCDPRLAVEDWTGPSAKLEACADLVSAAAEGGHRILLFSQFTSMLALLEAKLDELGITHFTLQGSTPKPQRADLVRRFNQGQAQVFLISLRAGGTGLNLTAADIVIHYDPWWNVAAQNQATDRAYRIGQQNAVQVYKLIAQDTLEEKILELQQAKQSLAESVVAAGEESILSMRPDQLLELLGG